LPEEGEVDKRTSMRRVARLKRQKRVRSRVVGTTDRPRLCVFRSNRHVYAQLIDDQKGVTLAAASTLSPAFKALEERPAGKNAALTVGELVAVKCVEIGVRKVVFDRNGFIFRKNGLVAKLAEGARKGGLEF